MLNEIVEFFVIAAARRRLWLGISSDPGLTVNNYMRAMEVVYDEGVDGVYGRLIDEHPEWIVTPAKSCNGKFVRM